MVVTSPVLSITPLPSGQVPPVAAVVGEVMCTVNVDAACVVSAGTVTGPHVRTPAAIAQLPFQPAPCEAIDQSRPAFVGSVSVKVHARRVPETVVVDGQREADRLTRIHLRRIRRLHDMDVAGVAPDVSRRIDVFGFTTSVSSRHAGRAGVVVVARVEGTEVDRCRPR